MNRGYAYALGIAAAIVLLVVGADSHVAILVLAPGVFFVWAAITLVNRSRGERRRRSLEARTSGDADLLPEGDGSSELAEEHGRLAPEDLRLKEYRTKRDEAEYELRPYLPANPRGAKRLINHERLYVQIAEDRGIFGGNPELTYGHLAKWVLIVEHWPRLGAALTRDPNKLKVLENCASVGDLQEQLELIDSNVLASDEMISVLGKGVSLSPVLGRLVRFEASVVSIQGAPLRVEE